MKEVVFITGSQKKAEYFSKLIGLHVAHQRIDIPEVQSLDLKTVVTQKAHHAFAAVNKPVLVEDVSLEFVALGRLPGTFIKWFQEELSHQELCELVNGKDRSAIARCMFGYYDGKEAVYFEGFLEGVITETPSNVEAFGWDPIFIPKGYQVPRGELSAEDDEKTYRQLKPIDKIAAFLKEG